VATTILREAEVCDAYLNVIIDDGDISASDTLAVTGTVTIVWANLGDY